MIDSPFSLQNKTILITGASSGLGRSIAIECSKAGANLILMGRNQERLEETKMSCESKNHEIAAFDLNDEVKASEFIGNIQELDGVVNSAGIANTELFKFLKEDSLREVMDTNFFAPLLFVQKLVKKKKIKNSGSIVFIASIAGTKITNYGYTSYSASKAAISGCSKTMALELAPKKIRVNCILPGMVRTNLINSIDSSQEDLDKNETFYPLGYGNPEDVAYASIYLLSDASKWITGTDLKMDGGFTLR